MIGIASGALLLAAALLPVPSNDNVGYASGFTSDQQAVDQAQDGQIIGANPSQVPSLGLDDSLLSRLRFSGLLKPPMAPEQPQDRLNQDQAAQQDQAQQPPQQHEAARQDQLQAQQDQQPTPQPTAQPTPQPTAQPAPQAPQPPQGQPAPTPGPDRTTPSSRGGARSPLDLSTHDGFIAAVADAALQSKQDSGVPPSVTIAQAILESDWGQSGLSKIANNFFGIKATKAPGPAGVVNMNTWEVLGGKNVTIKDGFKAYHTLLESVLDHGRFLADNPRYAAAFQVTEDANEFAKRIHAAGYATDPAYSTKLINLMAKLNLYQYDALTPAP